MKKWFTRTPRRCPSLPEPDMAIRAMLQTTFGTRPYCVWPKYVLTIFLGCVSLKQTNLFLLIFCKDSNLLWPFPTHLFLTAILHRGLRNDFFFRSHLVFPYFIWTFISLFFLDFYFPFLFGLLFPFSFWTFILS